MSLISSFRTLGKSVVARLSAVLASVKDYCGSWVNPFDVAAQVSPVTHPGANRTPGYGQQPTPPKRSRAPGKARPAGSKLARKAAKGTIGLVHAKGIA